MGRRRNSQMTSLWIDTADLAEIQRRARALKVSQAEVIRRMIRWGISAAAAEPKVATGKGL